VLKNTGEMLGVDYYELEYSADGGLTWNPLAAGGGVDFKRRWLDVGTLTTGDEAFPYQLACGRYVYESREHFEANNYVGDWWPAGDRFWLINDNLLVPPDSNADGTPLRAVGWDSEAAATSSTGR